jgi:hypothetical protein
MKKIGWIIAFLVVLPLAFSAGTSSSQTVPWFQATREPTGMAPDPAVVKDAVIQVYGARTVGWRGVLAVHTWISFKPANADRYSRYEVIGWGVERGIQAVRVDRMGPDNHWFGARPELYLDMRGPDVEPIIEKVKQAIADYPWPDEYRTWPGPNSNTFVAWVGRNVPELRLHLPPTAIGKDFLGIVPASTATSGTGLQLSLFGMAGGTLAVDEGIEVNLLGLVFGIDFLRPALKLPGIGRVGMDQN